MSEEAERADELQAAMAIAVTYLREGINIVDAAHAAMRFLNWAPSDEHAATIVRELATGQERERQKISHHRANMRGIRRDSTLSTKAQGETE